MVTIVKRKGHKEKFDEKKVYASVYAACVLCNSTEKECEGTATIVVREVAKFVKTKKEVDSAEIFKFVVDRLKKLNKEAAFMYETHRDIS